MKPIQFSLDHEALSATKYKSISDSGKTRPASATRCILLVASLCLGSGLACGKRRPPLPPVERVAQRTELLSGVQRGNQVVLSWPAPLVNAPSSSVQNVSRIDVYRLAEQPDAPLGLTETEFASRSTLVGSVPFESPQVTGRTLTYNDTLELAGQPSRLRYAVRYVNATNQRAGFSNFLLIEPAAKVANQPHDLRDQESESAITLSWSPPDSNIDGSTPVNLLGYNVYRTASGDPTPAAGPLNASLIQGNSFMDRAFQFGEEYTYVVRSVSLGTNGSQVESLNSEGLTVRPRDVYPPAAPNPVTIAPAPGRLSIFFPAGTEPDIAGYNIYRSEDPNQAPDRWTRLNSSPLTKTTYQDEAIQSGKRYYYYVVALDSSGNVSQPSETVSEVAP